MSHSALQEVKLLDIGFTPYKQAWQLQKKLFERISNSEKDHYLILTEHPPVITIGRSGSKDNLLAAPRLLESKGIELVEIDRGGDITFHGPGQLVVYPIFNLEHFKKDVHWYLRSLEEVTIQTLSDFAIRSSRHKKYTGVWVNNAKICAIGIKVTRWISMHGLALNVNTDLTFFNYIIPCGLTGKTVTSIKECSSASVNIADVKQSLLAQFSHIFGINLLKQEYESALL